MPRKPPPWRTNSRTAVRPSDSGARPCPLPLPPGCTKTSTDLSPPFANLLCIEADDVQCRDLLAVSRGKYLKDLIATRSHALPSKYGHADR